MTTAAKQTRNMSLDILRSVAMFFVICQHILGQGGLVEHAQPGSGTFYLLSFAQICVHCAVNIYGITTGYLLCEKPFRLARLTKLWLTTVFWSVAVSCCFFVFVPESRTVSEMVSMFLPILRGRYWFFTAYFVVMLVSPVLNLVIANLSRRQFHLLFAALFLVFGVIPVASLGYDVLRISTGHHFSWMIVLYLIGGYLRKNGHGGGTLGVKSPARWLKGYFLLAAVQLLYKLLMQIIGLSGWQNLLLTYPSPLILGEAICLFRFFVDACSGIAADGRTGRLMKYVSPGVYSVYVIHVHPQVFWSKDIIALFRPWDNWNALQITGAMLLTAAVVFAVCIILDALRQRLFRLAGIDRVADRLSDRLEASIRARIN